MCPGEIFLFGKWGFRLWRFLLKSFLTLMLHDSSWSRGYEDIFAYLGWLWNALDRLFVKVSDVGPFFRRKSSINQFLLIAPELLSVAKSYQAWERNPKTERRSIKRRLHEFLKELKFISWKTENLSADGWEMKSAERLSSLTSHHSIHKWDGPGGAQGISLII